MKKEPRKYFLQLSVLNNLPKKNAQKQYNFTIINKHFVAGNLYFKY